jgi:hypothetical protein
MYRLLKLIDQYLRARFAPMRLVKALAEDTLLGNDERCPLFSLVAFNSRKQDGEPDVVAMHLHGPLWQ